MSDWRMKDARRDVVFVDIDELVPKDHARLCNILP